MTICVFASSSSRINNEYATAASHLGLLLAQAKMDVVYGGGGIGLMGKLADAVLENGGTITGVIPSFMKDEGWDHSNVKEMIITQDMGDEEISIGDYVLTNGGLPAMVIVDAVTRLLPGALGKDESAVDESFSRGMLEYPHYTRPAEFRGIKVPEILLSGHHAEIEKWRAEQARRRTQERRPDLLSEQKTNEITTG